jgi:putative membrane protein insertion efficiency factor
VEWYPVGPAEDVGNPLAIDALNTNGKCNVYQLHRLTFVLKSGVSCYAFQGIVLEYSPSTNTVDVMSTAKPFSLPVFLGILLLFTVSSTSVVDAHEKRSPCNPELSARSKHLIQLAEGIPVLFYFDVRTESGDKPPVSSTAVVPLTAIHLYKRLISPYLGSRCRFRPTCSEFASQALEKKGFWAGIVMTADRLTRDHGFIRVGDYPQDETGRFLDPVEHSSSLRREGFSQGDATFREQGQRRQ